MLVLSALFKEKQLCRTLSRSMNNCFVFFLKCQWSFKDNKFYLQTVFMATSTFIHVDMCVAESIVNAQCLKGKLRNNLMTVNFIVEKIVRFFFISTAQQLLPSTIRAKEIEITCNIKQIIIKLILFFEKDVCKLP